MKIATLQFNPKLGDVEGNIRRADAILKAREKDLAGVDLLVLSEMAFTGYNFPSSKSISPYLEPFQTGPSGVWAQSTAKRLKCVVCVGYPEIKTLPQSPEARSESDGNGSTERYYNSVIITDRSGEALFNYRKRFLYYTDETWAAEGDVEWGGISLPVGPSPSVDPSNPEQQSPPSQVPTSMGVCMDINPYRFEAPFTDFEFASHVLESGSRLVVLPMAWLTLLEQAELDAIAGAPEMNTFNYWIQRFWPLITGKGKHSSKENGNNGESERDRETVIVFANRTGEEAGQGDNSTARYAGTSAIITIRRRARDGQVDGTTSAEEGKDKDEDLSKTDIMLWDILSRSQEGLCIADTESEPKYTFNVHRRADSSDGGSEDGHAAAG